ncbi:MAG TPA: hypothetical protein PK156_42435 [Polyangium sp.]|nr:hypothetical protein [Polyangium sp.]
MQKVARNFLRRGLVLGPASLVLGLFAQTSSAADAVSPINPTTTKEPAKTAFVPFVLAGGSVRIDDAPTFNITQRVGGNFGLGFLYHFQPFALGLSYEHSSLGREDSGVGPYGFVQIDRALDTVYASLKVHMSGISWGTPYFGIAGGLTWQDAKMKGVYLIDRGASGSTNFGCTGNDSINVALRVGGGIQFPLTSNVSFLTDVAFDAYRLSSDVIQLCAPGAGATSAFLFRAGLSYRFDMTESPTPIQRHQNAPR